MSKFAFTTNYQQSNFYGCWKSYSSEFLKNSFYETLIIEIGSNTWKKQSTYYADNELLKPIYSVFTEGFYQITGRPKTLKYTENILFYVNIKILTLLTEDQELINKLSFADCNLLKDKPVDISETGCSFIKSIKDIPKEYDIIKQENDQLFLGARVTDLSTESLRPTFFNYPLRRFDKAKEGTTVTISERPIYAIINVTIKDREKFMEYVIGHLPTIDMYGGKIIFESNDNKAVIGEVTGNFFLIQEWKSESDFYEWWNSPEYKPWREMRHLGADVNLILSKSLR